MAMESGGGRMRRFASFWIWVGLPLLGVAVLGALAPPPLAALRNLVFDTYQRIAPREWDPESPVRIVDVDEESLQRLGQWPWPRNQIAELVTKLTEAGAAVVAFDVVFSERDRTSGTELVQRLPNIPSRDQVVREISLVDDNDAIFARTIVGKPVVLGAIGVASRATTLFPAKQGWVTAGDDPKPFVPSFPSVVTPIADFWGVASGVGLLNWLPDRDQIIRRVPLLARVGETLAPSLALEALRVAQNASTIVVRASNASGETAFGAQSGVNTVRVGAFAIETDARGAVHVRFSHHEPRRFVPAWRVLAGEVPRDEIEGRVIFVGTSAAGLLDQRATPLDASAPGVEVHAQIVEHVLAQGRLARPDWAGGAELAAALAICLLLAFALPRVSALVVGAVGLVAILAAFGGSWQLFAQRGLLIDPVFPSLGAASVYIAGVMNLYRAEQAQRARVRNAFERFVAPAVVERLAGDPARLVLGGEIRTLTLLFTDLRSFTTLSEGMTAQELTRFMNEYLTPMTDIVLDHGGTVDKYMGDAIMAFWNAPLDDPDHARNAARASLAMIAKLGQLNEGWQARAAAEGRAFPVTRNGIGLATGDCCVGNLGSIRRFDYSAIGDDVNVAARLEGATKHYGVDLLAADATRDLAPEFAWLEADRVRLKGKTQATRVHILLGDGEVAKSPAFADLARAHGAMLEAYRARRFADCLEAAVALKARVPTRVAGLYAVYAGRSAAYLEAPPPPHWDGSFDLDEK
jgi:adenylate cyclase